ncbi:uridine kinase [Bacillus sp. NRRL B-14911]|nr:uridine kinase [Bacillus sp. NRRL B-14911]
MSQEYLLKEQFFPIPPPDQKSRLQEQDEVQRGLTISGEIPANLNRALKSA